MFVAWKGSRQMKIPVKPVKVSDVSCSTCEAENLCCFFWIILKDNMKNNWIMQDGRQLRPFPLSVRLFVHGMFFYFFPHLTNVFSIHTIDHLKLTLHVFFTWFFGYGGHPWRERVGVDPSLGDRLPLAHSCIKTATALRHCYHRQAVHRHVLWVWKRKVSLVFVVNHLFLCVQSYFIVGRRVLLIIKEHLGLFRRAYLDIVGVV